jgi:hypothetical protein
LPTGKETAVARLKRHLPVDIRFLMLAAWKPLPAGIGRHARLLRSG